MLEYLKNLMLDTYHILQNDYQQKYQETIVLYFKSRYSAT